MCLTCGKNGPVQFKGTIELPLAIPSCTPGFRHIRRVWYRKEPTPVLLKILPTLSLGAKSEIMPQVVQRLWTEMRDGKES